MSEVNYAYEALLKLLAVKVVLDRSACRGADNAGRIISNDLTPFVEKLEKLSKFIEEKRSAEDRVAVSNRLERL